MLQGSARVGDFIEAALVEAEAEVAALALPALAEVVTVVDGTSSGVLERLWLGDAAAVSLSGGAAGPGLALALVEAIIVAEAGESGVSEGLRLRDVAAVALSGATPPPIVVDAEPP